MADDPIRTAAAAESGLVKDTLLEATVKRTIYVLDVGELWADLDQSVGEKRLAIVDAATSYLYLYDASDTTTADDGLTCRVTGTGERYHIEDAASISISSVLDVTDTPPGSPSNYDAYICDTASTGAWSGHDTEIAIYTRRGWIFAEPEVGMTVLDLDTGANLQFDDNGDWINFAVEIADDSVLPVQLAFPAGVAIEAQQNAPPSVPGDPATTYLVGAAGSGAWSGHNNALAFSRDGSTWSFIAAYEGATVYNKATDVAYRYNGTAWVSVASGIVDYQAFTTPGAGSWTKPTGLPANAMLFIQGWGGGGGGGGNGSGVGGGGGGGAYREMWVRADEAWLSSPVSLSVGAGGTGAASGTAAPGGNSTFGTKFTAYGGGGGSGVNGGGGNGGGGGGWMSAGGDGNSSLNGGDGGTPQAASASITGSNPSYAGGGYGGRNTGGGSSYYGGGGGSGINGQSPGSSIWGGAGGNPGHSTPPTPGTSVFGGNGATVQGGNGAAPGGGGGGRGQNGSPAGGNGARGEIRVTVYA